jgi:hypothetical protein
MTSSSGPLFVGPDVAGWQTVAVVAQPSQPNEPKPGQGDDFGKSSPVGLLVLLLFFIAVAFLVRSMTKHLKKVPASFEKPDETPAEEPAESEPEEKPADDSVEEKK